MSKAQRRKGAKKKFTYAQKKEFVRQLAINWQARMSSKQYSYGELAEYTEKFERLGRKYGLLYEFRENGIV